ncbi:MAG: NAD-dependent epimerase/dehydratase family protein [Myxococcales bacterium]|nr:NAD-dependent epimerase/dehydratase family protein [Myxococcales bacterium]
MSDATQRNLPAPIRYDPEHRVVAVTGACSVIGDGVIARLEQDRRYVRVVALDVRKPDRPLNKTVFHKLDLTEPNAGARTAELLERERVDTVLHAAFLARPTRAGAWAHELEVIGTSSVLAACAACRLHKVVLFALAQAYGAHPRNPNYLEERHERRGMEGSRFFADKLEAERMTERFAQENPATLVTILRCAPILGPNARNFVARYLSRPVAPVIMGYDPLVQLLHESDAIDAFMLCLDADFRGTFNIASDGVLPLSTLLALAGRVAMPMPHGLAAPLSRLLWMTQVSTTPPTFLDFLRYLCVVDTERARRVIGFEPRFDIRQTIAQFAGTEAAPAARAKLEERTR